MNARQLSHFLAAYELRSLQQAAERMNLSQPAMGKSIARLEEEYGLRLFERTPRGLSPTRFADELQRHAQRILADIERSRASARHFHDNKVGPVAIGAGPSFIGMVNEIVSRMIADQYRGVFTILQEYNDNLRRRLQLNQIDLYIAMITGREDPDEFRTELAFTDRIVCACRSEHPILSGPVSNARLLDYPWIAHEDGEIGRVMIEGYFRGQQLATPSIAVTTNADKTLRHFLRSTDMIAVVPEVVLNQPGYAGIEQIRWKRLSFKRKVGVVTRVGPPFSLAVEEFVKRLRTHLGAARGLAQSPLVHPTSRADLKAP